MCEGPFHSIAEGCEVLDEVLLSLGDQTVDEAGQHSGFGATCICLVGFSSPEEQEITMAFVSWSLSCLLGCEESLLPRGCAVPHAMRPLSKVFSGAQTVE